MFEEILSKLALTLDERSIPYMIIGGQAVLLYGEPRLTRDIDVTLGVGIDALEKIIEVCKELILTPLPLNIAEFVEKTMVLPAKDETTGIRIDFIFSFTLYEKQAIQRAKKIFIKKAMVKFSTPEDVIIHKIFAGRTRDLDDVQSILIKNPSVDLPYIKKWLVQFDKGSPKRGFWRKFGKLLSQMREENNKYPTTTE